MYLPFSVSLCVSLSVCLSVCLSVSHAVFLSAYQTVGVCLSVYLSGFVPIGLIIQTEPKKPNPSTSSAVSINECSESSLFYFLYEVANIGL